MKVLEVKGISKKLSGKEVLKNISFSVEEGEIYGFLGPNGAGKTTTIKIIVGLIEANRGQIMICSKDLKKNREEAIKNVGAIVENPSLYEYLSGYENLMQIARMKKVSKESVEEIIELVGLKDRIKDKVKRYSLGMKQRLGIGAALIGEPKLLILDEPTNGLDPYGIMELRELMKKLAKERNIAIFISSHILSEIELVCDKVCFIAEGKIMAIEELEPISEEKALSPLEKKFIELTRQSSNIRKEAI